MNPNVSFQPVSRAFNFARGVCAITGLVAIAGLSACVTMPEAKKPLPPAASTPVDENLPPPGHPLTGDQPGFAHLSNSGPHPVRVGVLLPFSNGSAATRALAANMMKSAELALYESGNPDLMLVSADEGSTPATAAAATRSLLSQGAEIIVGPLFSASASVAGPIARDHGVPLISFSTDKAAAGKGVYLLSFQPENEVKRVVSYAIAKGHKNFAAIVPLGAYGSHVSAALKEEVEAEGGTVIDIEHLDPGHEEAAAHAIAKSDADAILIAEGGATLRELAPMLDEAGVDRSKVMLLGSGLWYDPSITHETMLANGVFAAPEPDSGSSFNSKFHAAFGAEPPQLAALAYDAVSLAALLASGEPYHRYTAVALTDPSGFAGVNGIFRFNPDGTAERGLAILKVTPEGFRVADPPPSTFEDRPDPTAPKKADKPAS